MRQSLHKWLLLLPLLLATWTAGAQTLLQQESFETNGEGTRYVSNYTVLPNTVPAGSPTRNQYWFRASEASMCDGATTPCTGNLADHRGTHTVGGTLNGTFYWAGEGVRGGTPTTPGVFDRVPGTVTLNSVTTTGYRNLQVVVGLQDGRYTPASQNWESDDTLKVQVRFNGAGPWVTVGQFTSDATVLVQTGPDVYAGQLRQDVNLDGKATTADPLVTATMQDFTFNLPSTATTLQTRFVASQAGLSEEFSFDNIRVMGIATANAAPVLANIESTVRGYPTANAAVQITNTITLTDADNPTQTSAIVRITTGWNPANDVLAFAGTGATGNIAGAYSTTTGVLTLTSAGSTATLAQWQAALRLVTFQTNTAIPSGSQGRAILFATTDPSANQSNAVFRTVGYAPAVAATVITTAVGTVTPTSAVLGGNVTNDGGDAVTDRGVVYVVGTGTPTTSNTKVQIGTGTGSFSQTITGLAASTQYTVRAYAINSAGTAYGSNVTFTTPAALTATAVSQTNVSCFGGSNGSATVSASGGVAPYTYSWSPSGGTAATASGLAAGTYTVTVTDASSAMATRSFTITQPASAVSGTRVVTNVSCNGGSNGTINLTPAGGTAPYTFLWNGGTTTEDRTGLMAGTYSVTITDANGCQGTVANIIVTQPGALTTTGSQANVSTNGGSDGTATVTPSGGAPSYTYVWSNGATTQSVTGLSAGTYNVTVTDANGCTTMRSFTITQPAAAMVTSVTRLMPSPAATAQVSYQVTLSASVTGVSVGNFSLTTTGLSGATVSNVSGSGTTFTVNVNTGTGDGTLRLNVANSTGISPALSNVPFTSGEVYTITKSFAAAPQLTIQGTGSAGSDVTAFVDVVQVLSGGSPFANALQNGSFETHGPLGNGDYGYNPTGANWTFNTRSGIAEQGSAFTPVTPVPNGVAVAFVQSESGINGQLQQNLTLPTGSSYQVRFQTAQRVCCSTADQALNVFLNGVFVGTILPGTSAYSTFTSATFSVTAPALTATISSPAGASGSSTGTSPIPYTVTFSQAVTGFSAAGVSVTNGTVSGFSGSGNTYTFSVTPATPGTVTVNIPANGATDANNTGNTASNSYSLTFTAPTIAVAPATLPNGTVATAYSQAITASGGTAPYTYTVTAGALPTGLTLSSGGTLSGTPIASGTFNFTIKATDAAAAPGPYSGARAYALTIGTQPVTAAPVVNTPANNSITNNRTVTVSGTAPANSTVTIYIGTAVVNTVTATASGTFSAVVPGSAPDGTYTVKARAQSAGEIQSVDSNVNTFTVDGTAPTVAISSSTAANGGSTSTSPIAYTVTFSEAVTSFVAGDVSVTNGTLSGFTAVSGTTYTFNVTPAGNGAVTVNVPANGAQDAAGNGNTAASPYTITYVAPATATAWTGNVSTDWFVAGNWTEGVPTSTLDATIPAAMPRMPTVAAGTANARNLTIASGATLTHTGGTLVLAGSFLNNGTFAAPGGTVALGSSTGQTAGGSSLTRFWNLRVDAAGAALTGRVAVQRLLTLTGNLATNGQPLTLESTVALTAVVVNTGGVVMGTATVQRAIDPSLNPGLGYRHYAAPVGGSTVADLSTSGFSPVVNPAYNTAATPNLVTPFPTVYGYDQARLTLANSLPAFDKGFFSPAATTDALAVGRGYTVNLSATEVVDFAGTLNNGDLQLTLARNAPGSTNEAEAGWQFVGNPYPAPLDYSLVAPADRANLDAAIYVYQSTSQYAGQYRVYVNGVGNPVLPVAQGFFARVSAGQSSGALTFRNSQRLTAPGTSTFQRGTADTRPLLQLELRGATGPADAAYVYFEAGATADFDAAYDAAKLPNSTGLNLASWIGGKKVAVNALPVNTGASVTVPLFVGLPASGTYTLHAAQLLNFGPGSQPFLRDLQLNTLTDLSRVPTYTFTMNAADNTPRFELVFGAQQVLSTAAAALARQVAVFPNPATKAVSVELPYVLRSAAVTAVLVDALGRVVLQQVLPAGQPTHTLSLANVATGVYALRLQTKAGLVIKKLVVN